MVSEDVQNLLITKRKELGYSQRDIADLLDVNITRQYYGLIEKGQRTPSPQVAKSLGELLDFDWTIFFE